MKTGTPIKFTAGVTILCSKEAVELHIEDRDAGIRILELKMTPEDFTAALGRLAFCPAEAVAWGLDKVGMVLEHDKIIFPLDCEWDSQSDFARAQAVRICQLDHPDWTPEMSFSSQDSFFNRDGRMWARTTIRRWVPKK